MRPNVIGIGVLCVAVILSCAGGPSAYAQEIKLDYEPKKGDSAAYDLQVHAKVTDENGLTLVTHATSVVKVEVSNVKRDPDIPVDQDNITGANIDISQKAGSVKFVSGDNEKTVDFEDRSVEITSFKSGGMVKVMGGETGQAITDSIMRICTEVGAGDSLTAGNEWKQPVALSMMGETVSGEVTYKFVDVAEVGGRQCIIVESTGGISHKFKSECPVKKLDMTWQGKVCYAYADGTFAQVVVEAKATGVLRDGTQAQVADFNLQMTPHEEGAALPATGAKGALAGPAGGFPALTIFLAAAILLAFGAAAGKINRPLIRKALVCGLSAVVVISGSPMSRAQAASPPGLIAFSGMAMQALHDVAGLTVAGGAGVGMSGTPAGILSTPYGTVVPWAGMPVSDATDDLEGGFLQTTEGDLEPVGGVEPTAGAGPFSTRNVLIGGGVLLASAGAGIAAADTGGGGGGGAWCPTTPALIDFEAPPNPFPPKDISLQVYPRVFEGPDVPPDEVDVYLNGEPLGRIVMDNTAGGEVTFDLSPGGDLVTIQYVSGGSNDCAIFKATFRYLGGAVHNPDVWLAPGTSTSCTITLQQPE